MNLQIHSGKFEIFPEIGIKMIKTTNLTNECNYSNRYNKPVSLNKERGYYDWDSNTIKTIIREDWWTADGTVRILSTTLNF